MSLDGGKTWRGLQGTGHGDYHAIWINPKDPRVVAVGHDGGLDISNDGGFSWDYHNDMALGQFYQVSADMRRPYYVCGGLQDNQAWCGPSAVRSGYGGVNTDWYNVGGGDGFYTRQDPERLDDRIRRVAEREHERHDLRNGTSKSIRPNAGGGGRGGGRGGAPAAEGGAPGIRASGTARRPVAAPVAAAGGGGGSNILNAPSTLEPFRFYWNTPFEISPHNPAVVYMAAQYFFKSTNRGDTWTMNTKDLTKNVDRFSTADHGRAPATRRWRPSTTATARTRSSRKCASPRRVPASSGWAPTTAICRSARTAARRFTNVIRQHLRRAEGLRADLAHRAVAFRRGHGVRRARQPSQRRLEAVPLQDDGLRQDVDERRGQPAGQGQHQRAARGPTTIRTCCSSARSSACSCRSTAARTGRSS